MKELYEQKGYPKDWIDKRLRGIAIRQNLTDEWSNSSYISSSLCNLLILNKRIRFFLLRNFCCYTLTQHRKSIVSNQNFLLGSELDTSEPQLPFDTDDE